MVAIIVSLVVVGAGLWLGVGQAGTEMASFGWLLAVLGLVFLAVNLYLRRRGFRTPRRRP
jgi:phage-related protein